MIESASDFAKAPPMTQPIAQNLPLQQSTQPVSPTISPEMGQSTIPAQST
jgi:hypothetical protein